MSGAASSRAGWVSGGGAMSKGMVTVKVDPSPSRLSTRMVPFIFSTRLLTMAIPRPVP